MKAINVIIIAVIFLTVLVGCTPAPVIKTVTQIEFKAIDLPPVLLKPCSVTEPPPREDYLAADDKQREEYLTLYTLGLLGDLKVCNNQIHQLKLIRDEQIKAYQSKDQESK